MVRTEKRQPESFVVAAMTENQRDVARMAVTRSGALEAARIRIVSSAALSGESDGNTMPEGSASTAAVTVPVKRSSSRGARGSPHRR